MVLLSPGEDGLTAFQVASLDDRGILTLWLPTETNRDFAASTSSTTTLSNEDEPCGSLNGKIHLVRSRSIQVLGVERGVAIDNGGSRGRRGSGGGGGSDGQERLRNEVNWDVCVYEDQGLTAGPCAQCLCFSPSDLNCFLVGLSDGRVVRRSRFGESKPPQVYIRAEGAGQASAAAASNIHYSPFSPIHFLVGYSDGVVALFAESYGQSIVDWDTSMLDITDSSSSGGGGGREAKSLNNLPAPEVTFLSWSPHRPAVFYVVLGNRAQLLVYDLLVNDQEPLVVQSLGPRWPQEGPPARVALSCERANHIAAGQMPCLAVAGGEDDDEEGRGCGGAKLRQLRKSLFHMKANEAALFEDYLQKVL